MPKRILLILAATAIIISSCRTGLPFPTETSPSLIPIDTASIPTSTPQPTLQPSLTSSVTAALSPTHSPVVHRPSPSPEGPWVIAAGTDQVASEQKVLLFDLHGSGYAEYTLGPTSEVTIETIAPNTPVGATMLAVRTRSGVDTITTTLLSLPNLERVADFDLYGDQARDAKNNFVPEYEGQIAPVWASISNTWHPFEWSPDGRYLALVAAIDGPSTDVYSFDIQSSKLRRLTFGPDQAELMGWSPDSEWIIHNSNSSVYESVDIHSVWAASIRDGTIAHLYDPHEYSIVEHILGWRSTSAFLVQSGFFEACDGPVKMMSLPNGAATNILTEPHVMAEFNPDDRILLYVRWPPGSGYCEAQNSGLFALDLSSGSSNKILDGMYYQIDYLPEARLFTARREHDEQILFDATGRIVISASDICCIVPSPDGSLFLLSYKTSNWSDIVTREGATVKRITTEGSLSWEGPTSDLVCVDVLPDGTLQISEYLATSGWDRGSTIIIPSTINPSNLILLMPE